MSAGIVQGIDAGAVGFTEVLGKTWHGFVEYEHVDGPVPIELVRKKIVHPVAKVPLKLHAPEGSDLSTEYDGEIVPTMFALVRTDTGHVLYEYSVTDDYTVYDNGVFLDRVEKGVLNPNPKVAIESCGTLMAGRVAFVNIMLDRSRVQGDDSETVYRLMYYNAFGGKSIAAGMHGTRIVCNNTLNIAEAQAEANTTLQKFKHTSGAPERVEAHLVDLSVLYHLVSEHKADLNNLASQQMTGNDVEAFLSIIVPIDDNGTPRIKTRRQNKRDQLQSLFESREDLQGGIARSRFAMLQAVTYYSAHNMVNKRADETYAYFDTVTGGVRDLFNQKALKALLEPDLVLAAS